MCLLMSRGHLLLDKHSFPWSALPLHGLPGIWGLIGGSKPLFVAHLTPSLQCLVSWFYFHVEVAL
jgi:hypothetical protein